MENLLIAMPENLDNIKLPDPTLLTYYQDLENRTYTLFGEVDDSLIDFSTQILKWNKEDKGLAPEERKPIKFFIHSPGGDLDIYRSVRDVIELSKTPIIAINIGNAYSAAAMLFLCCKERYMLKSASILLHKGSASLAGNYNEVKAAIDEYNKQVEEFTTDIQKYTDYSTEEIESKMNSDWYIDASEALAHKAATKIVEDIDDLI